MDQKFLEALELTTPFSSALFRIGFAIFLLVYTYIIRKNYPLPFKNGLLAVPLILLARDILSIFIPIHPPLFFITDGAIISLYAFLLEFYHIQRKRIISFVLYMGIGMLVLTILYFVLNQPIVMFLTLAGVSIFMSFWFARLIFSISAYNSPNYHFIVKIRAYFLPLFITSRILLVFDPAVVSPFTLFISVPLNYIPYIYIIIQYHLHFHSLSSERDQFINKYIDSLFEFMRTIGNAMTERIEVKKILRYVMDTMMKFSGSEAGVVLLRDQSDNSLKVEIMEGYFPPPFAVPLVVKAKLQGVQKLFETTHIKEGETILGEISKNNQARFVRNTAETKEMELNAKDDTLYISSFIGVPLIVNKEVFGVAAIALRKKDKFFSQLDFDRAKIFVEYASLTLDSLYNYSQLLEKQEIEREVSIAANIQKKLLPSRQPKRIQDMVAAFTRPAKGVSGDYYDIIPLTRAGKFALVICDVAGKGVPASMIMVMIRTIVHLIAGIVKDAGQVAGWINRGIATSVDIERFATMSYLTIDPETGVMEYANAGHHPAMVYRIASGEIERIDAKGLPVGLERDSNYASVKHKLDKGDVVMLYTDGIIESLSPSGEQYEEERLKEIFKANINDTPKKQVDFLINDIEKFVAGGKQHDDMTLIICKLI